MTFSFIVDFIQSIDLKDGRDGRDGRDGKDKMTRLQEHLHGWYAQCSLLKQVFQDIPSRIHPQPPSSLVLPQLPCTTHTFFPAKSGTLQEILSNDEADAVDYRSLSYDGNPDEPRFNFSPDQAAQQHLGMSRGMFEYASLDSNYGSADRYVHDSDGSESLESGVD